MKQFNILILSLFIAPTTIFSLSSQELSISSPVGGEANIRAALVNPKQALQNRLAEANAMLQAVRGCHENSPKQFYGRLTPTSPLACVDPLALLAGAATRTIVVATISPIVSPGYSGPAFVPSEYIGVVASWDMGLVNHYNNLRANRGQAVADQYLLNHYRDHGVVGPTGTTTGARLPGYQKSPWTEQKYLASNPDVREFLAANPGMTALEHYKNYGIYQGRAWCCIEDWRTPARPIN
jgi:hypothetical protein